MSKSKKKSTVSEAQLIANRNNALKSTGPKTREGKEKTRANAYRHGHTGHIIIQTDDDCVAHREFTKAFVAELAPEGFIETDLAWKIADSAWRLNRIRATEDNYLSARFASDAKWLGVSNEQAQSALVHATVFIEKSKEILNLSLYEQRLDRLYHKNMKALEDMKTNRPLKQAAEPPKTMATAAGSHPRETPQDDSTPHATAETSTPSEQNGFVLSTPPTPSEPQPNPAPEAAEIREPGIPNAA